MSSSANRVSKYSRSPAINSMSKNQERRLKSNVSSMANTARNSPSSRRSTWTGRMPILSTSTCAWTASSTMLKNKLRPRSPGTSPSSSSTLMARSCTTTALVTIPSNSRLRSRRCCERLVSFLLRVLYICILEVYYAFMWRRCLKVYQRLDIFWFLRK